MLSSVQKAKRIYVRDIPGQNEKLIQALKEVTSQLGVQLKIIGPGTYPPWEMWLQDIMEVGYSKTPFQGNHVVLKANRGRPLDDMPEKEILGPDHGWFRFGEYRPEAAKGQGGDGWLDWYGNLEVTPPLPGKPFGRIFYGYNKYTGRSLNPQIVQMLEAQAVQTPLIKIHTGWLLIKHVDEIFNFVPAKGGKGFKVLVPDTVVTYRLLDRWISEGKGSLPIFKDLRKNETLQALAKDGKLRDFNGRLQKQEIEFSIDSMKSAIEIDENDIIRTPALFEPYEGYAPALMPNMVNSVYLNGHMLMADPRGPLDAGKDLIQEYVKALLNKEGVEVHFVDDLAYHNRGGNVHCATNVTYLFGQEL
jgi:protein-arginine deiminase